MTSDPLIVDDPSCRIRSLRLRQLLLKDKLGKRCRMPLLLEETCLAYSSSSSSSNSQSVNRVLQLLSLDKRLVRQGSQARRDQHLPQLVVQQPDLRISRSALDSPPTSKNAGLEL